MSNQPDNNTENLNISKQLGDIGKVLGDALKDQPYLAGFILILVIVALVSLAFAVIFQNPIFFLPFSYLQFL